MDEPNILLVILDSLRARNCGLYGYHRDTTPFLSGFSDEAVVFEQARAPSIHSISSHASIFTGYHTEEHGISEHKSFVKEDATVWKALSDEHGYETGLFTPNAIVTLTSNLGSVFDECVGPKRVDYRLFDGGMTPFDVQGDITPLDYIRVSLSHEAPVRSVLNGVYKKFTSRGGSYDPRSENASVYIDDFFGWVESADGPWAACLNLMDTHYPYVPEPEYDLWGDSGRDTEEEDSEEDDLSSYDGTIRQADAAVGRLVERLSEAGMLEETVVVITSDHGEGFGERSEVDPDVRIKSHSWGISEVLTHVPLVLWLPDEAGGRKISEPASLTNFPAFVEAVLDTREDPARAFVPEKQVVSSTYRVKSSEDADSSEGGKHHGPWRAVYRQTDDGVVKHAKRGDDGVTLLVPDAQRTVKRSDDDGGMVDRVFSEFQDAGVKQGTADEREMASEVEERLEDLGYLG
ncbi:MAG: sulfatase-like hydrolase/transferase [Halobacteriales archaeon]|nr:sulfatase-like hydrolase/transferase [Halobacteriales archaeon]